MMNGLSRIIARLHPGTLILLSFVAAVCAGTGLLMLPGAAVCGRLSLLDALFTATSAVCVTGLIVVDTGSYFTLFGQIVILVLIQIGALGVMTISTAFFHLLGKHVFFKQRMAMQEIYSSAPRADIYRLVKSIFLFTAMVEGIGAVLLWIFWQDAFGPLHAAFPALFHAVSAFCNAGFSLFSDSLMGWAGSAYMNLVMAGLIIVGGIGFSVAYEIRDRMTARRGARKKLSLQTKTVLATTLVLLGAGTVILFLTEFRNPATAGVLKGQVLAAFFQSVTCRTAGFNTVDIGALGNATLAFMMFLMVFGASPGSCGGGLKTTTLAVLAAFSWSRFTGGARVNLFHKSVPRDTVSKSLSAVVLAVGIISVSLFVILWAHPMGAGGGQDHRRFLEYFFEVVSAFGTVGLSMGVTAELNAMGKGVIILLMLLGRVGPLTFLYALAAPKRWGGFEYAEEDIMIG